MVFEGHEPDPVGMTFTAGIDKADGGIRKVIENFQWDNWRGPWDPVARLHDMDRDGVEMEVLYPSMDATFTPSKATKLRFRKRDSCAYNDWLRDYCCAVPRRLIGLGLLSALDIDWSVQELERCAKLGHKGALLPSELSEGQSYADPMFDRLWAAAQDMGFAIHFHASIIQVETGHGLKWFQIWSEARNPCSGRFSSLSRS